MPLLSICEARDINWDYDIFTRKITLTRQLQKINLMVGSSKLMVNGSLQDIRYPVDIYRGAVVVPYRFKRRIIDSLFKLYLPEERPDLTYIRRIKKIIIDPGHGGKDPGAIGRSGLREKDVNLDITRRLKQLLVQQGIEVIMTRNYDKTLSLASRSRLANSKDADLFVSIHANSNRVRSLSGFEVYYLSSKIDDSLRALTTAKKVDLDLENATFLEKTLILKATLWDLIYTRNRAESIELAQYICKAVNNNLHIKTYRIKGAPFYVLKNTRTPAILIEVGYISNPYEEKKLSNRFYRQQIAEAIALGINNYSRGYLIIQAHR